MLTPFHHEIDLAELLDEALTAAETAGTENPSADVARMAGMALELARVSDQVLDALEALKDVLRDAAAPHIPEDDNVVRLKAVSEHGERLGYVAVTFPEDSVKVKKTADIRRLRRALGDHFQDLFTEDITYTPAQDFKERTTAALKDTAHPERAAEARVAMAAVEVKASTPRVGFKPDPQFLG